MTYTQHRDTQETLTVLDTLDLDTEKPSDEEIAKRFGYEDDYYNGTVSWWQRTKPKIWLMFDEPYSSFAAKIIGVISVFFICISILSFCLKTHPDMRVPVIRNVTIRTGNNVTAWTLDKHSTNPHDAFFYIECICNAWFSIEIIVRYCEMKIKLNCEYFYLVIFCMKLSVTKHKLLIKNNSKRNPLKVANYQFLLNFHFHFHLFNFSIIKI